MPADAIILSPYRIDWAGHEAHEQAFLRAFITLGGDLSRQFHGPLATPTSSPVLLDAEIGRFVNTIQRIPVLRQDPTPPSRHYQPPPAIVMLGRTSPFSQSVVQLSQRLISAAPSLARAAWLLIADFRDDRVLPLALNTAGALDREDLSQLPILTLSGIGTRLVIAERDTAHPYTAIAQRMKEALGAPERQRTGPQPTLAPYSPTPPASKSAEHRLVLDEALRTGDERK